MQALRGSTNRMLKTNRLTLLAAMCFALPAVATADPATDASIREYFQISGQEAAAVETMNRFAPTVRQMAKDIPDDLFRELTRTDNIVTSVIPVYRKYFSEEELQDLIAFHKTPTGSKFGNLATTIQRETMEISANRARMAVINYQVQKGRFKVEPKRD